MAQDIVSGLFGQQPWEIQQAQQAALGQAADKYATQSPIQQGIGLLYRAGGGMGDLGAGMLGYENPAIAQAQQRQTALQDLDVTSPEKIMEKAQQVSDPRMRMQLMLLAHQKAAEQQKLKADATKMRLDEARTERELALAEKAARGEPAFKYAPEVAKLISLRDSLPENDPRRKILDAAIAKATHIKQESGAAAGGKPKGLSREAGLKWELDNGLISQETYDQAMSATPGGKLSGVTRDKQAKSFEYLDKKFTEIENAMADSLGIEPSTLAKALSVGKGTSEQRLDRAVGFIDAWVPSLTQTKANILSHIERLKSLGQTGGLAELRAFGVAPGSITEREWPKFQADLANIDERLDAKELLKQYIRIFQKIQDTRTKAKEEIANTPEANGEKEWNAQTPEDVRALYKAGTINKTIARFLLRKMEK